MPFCPTCRTEYEPSVRYCEACQMDVVDTLPPQENADASAGGLGLVELARFANVSEAEMIRELLEKNDIGTVLRGEVDPIGSASGAEPTTLLVEERDLPRAQALYEAYFAGDAIQGALNEPE